MALVTSRIGKIFTGLVSAAVLAGTLTASSAASAHYFSPFGFGAAGFALGAVAASAAQPDYGYGYGYGDCYVTHHRFVDSWGNEYVRRVRVCD